MQFLPAFSTINKSRRELPPNAALNGQRGAVLVISLGFLLIMTLIGITAIQGTTQEEKLASNTMQRVRAFQSAEAGLRMAEKYVREVVAITGSTVAFDDTNLGLHPPISPTTYIEDYWNNYNWLAPTPGPDGGSILGDELDSTYSSPPRYVIERLQALSTPSTSTGGDISAVKRRNTTVSATIFLYRLTVRGVGDIPDAVTILQSLYVN